MFRFDSFESRTPFTENLHDFFVFAFIFFLNKMYKYYVDTSTPYMDSYI